jgi:hypothetical protein
LDVIVIFNGLGNQMSQYAFYLKKKSINSNTEFITFCNDHNGLELDKIFNINCKKTLKRRLLYYIFRLLLTDKLIFIISPIKFILNSLGVKIIKENFNYSFNQEYLKPKSGINYYFGGWHSEKYFISESTKIKNNFLFNTKIFDEAISIILSDIKLKNSVSIHIRRGDFLNKNNINLFGNICDLNYFNNTIKEIESNVDNPHYYIFSNDMQWVKQNLFLKNVTYIEGNNKYRSWMDMFLMSKCKHNIISNSSFSWWGAWLNQNPNKIVICPNKFSTKDINTDVYPDSWLKIQVQ